MRLVLLSEVSEVNASGNENGRKGRTQRQESLPSTRKIFSTACWMLGAILYCERAGLVCNDRLCSHKDERSVGFEKIDANCEVQRESEFMRTRKSCSS